LNMLRQTVLLFALSTFSATCATGLAQDSNSSGSSNAQNGTTTQAQAAPIERVAPPAQQQGTMTSPQDAANQNDATDGQADGNQADSNQGNANQTGTSQEDYTYNTYVPKVKVGQLIAPTRGTASAEPGLGIYLRVGDHGAVRAVALSEDKTQLKVEHGIANISVHNSVDHAQIMIDLPRGQVTLVKDGFYTFNADSNTVRVIKGEAYAYPADAANAKPIKVKEDHAVTFNGAKSKPFEFHPYEARADVIPYAPGAAGTGTTGYQAGPYGYGYAGPYAYGYPYAYGDPFFYGYPFGWGLGLGFYGGWGWGGYGGWGRGWDRDDWGRGGRWGGRGGGWGGRGGRGGGFGGHGGGFGGGHAGGGGGHR
jgi:hypothetical protein